MSQRILLALPLLTIAMAGCDRSPAATEPVEVAATLTVEQVSPKKESWPQRVVASGHVEAWQEGSIGSELGGVRLDEVRVNVGDHVRAGQLLARFNEDSLRADLAQIEATVAEAKAILAKSEIDLERATMLERKGAVSKSELLQLRTQVTVNAARVQSAEAQRDSQALRVKRARVLAPDDGVISARNATVGAVTSAGAELFRFISRGRLEWRAQVRADAVPRLKPGTTALIQRSDGSSIKGVLRQTAPTVNPDTLTGLAYVDLPADSGLAPGMFVNGEFELSASEALSLPESALIFRDGNRYAMKIDADLHVQPVKVRTGRREGTRVEIIEGVAATDRFVLSGGAFLSEGDKVEVAAP